MSAENRNAKSAQVTGQEHFVIVIFSWLVESLQLFLQISTDA